MTIEIPAAALETMSAHARASYTEEACGFLIGRPGPPRRVTEARSGTNVAKEDRRTRYRIDDREVLRLERELRNTDLQMVGFYHSHPDHPAVPSEYDRSHAAWTGFSYVIVSVESGDPVEVRSWVIEEEAPGGESKRSFKEEEIVRI
jgi:proteasome lid subunit RPN8/RPN11